MSDEVGLGSDETIEIVKKHAAWVLQHLETISCFMPWEHARSLLLVVARGCIEIGERHLRNQGRSDEIPGFGRFFTRVLTQLNAARAPKAPDGDK